MGTSGRGQDHAGEDRRHAARTPLLHPFGRHVGREGRARGDRIGQETAFLRRQAAAAVHRRNPPLQQIAAGFAAGRRRAGHRDADRRHDRKPLVRSDLAAAEPLSGLHSPPDGGQGPADAAGPCAHDRRGTQGPRSRSPADRRALQILRRRRPQTAQHPRHPRRGDRRQTDHHRPIRHRLSPAEYRTVRQKRRTALRRHLGLHQVGAATPTPRSTTSRACWPGARSRAFWPGGW